MVQVRIKELFAQEIAAGIKQFTGGRDSFDYESMSPEEEDSVRLAFDKSLKKIEYVSPKLAQAIRPQREAFVKWAGVAKGTFPETKSYSYPATAGGLGADWITPELYIYDTTASATYPCYTHYNSSNGAYTTFDLTLAAGTERFIAGTATTTTYKGSITSSKHSFVVIAQDGLVEVGTTPKCSMMKINTDLQSKYSAYALQPLMTQTMEDNKTLYQYNTPGMIPMDYNVGTALGLYPNVSGTSTIVPLGMVFYEYDFITTIPRTNATP